MRVQLIVNCEHGRAQVNLQVNLEPEDAVDHPQEEQHHRQGRVISDDMVAEPSKGKQLLPQQS